MSPENIITVAIVIIAMYDPNKENFVFFEIELRPAKNNVMTKYGATNAFVKNDKM